MFRTACIFVALALCAATAPPRISLELADGAFNAAAVTRSHNRVDATTFPDSTNTGSPSSSSERDHKDLSQFCEANDINGATNTGAACKFPIAKAYDHLDGDISLNLTKVYTLVDSEQTAFSLAATCTNPCSDLDDLVNPNTTEAAIKSRSTYLFTYDVKDKVGNDAEQVTFALIINDMIKPVVHAEEAADGFSGHGTDPLALTNTIESGSGSQFDGHEGFSCTDPMELDAMTAVLTQPAGGTGSSNQWRQMSAADICSSTFQTTAKCTDDAGWYSADGINGNFASMTVTTTYQDTTPPTLLVGTKNLECDKTATTTGLDTSSREGEPWSTCADNEPVAGNLNPDYLAATSITNNLEDDYKAILIPTGTTGMFTTTAPDHAQFPQVCTDACNRNNSATRTIIVTDTTPPTVDPTYIENVGSISDPHSVSTASDGTTTRTFHIVPPTSADWDAKCKPTTDNHHADTATHNSVTCAAANDFNNETGVGTEVYSCDSSSCVLDETGVGTNTFKWHVRERFADTCCLTEGFGDHLTEAWSSEYVAPDPRAGTSFPSHLTGTYTRTFTIADCSGNTNSVGIVVVLQDPDAPVIHMEGCEENHATCMNHEEASNTVEYTDYGAQCHDYVDGVLSHAVEVSGMVVNMRVVGTYLINYDCADLSGNAAEAAQRTVIVQDTTPPVCLFDTAREQGVNMNFVEAGFPYVDAGVTMSDSLDGECVEGQSSYSADVQCNGPAESPTEGHGTITVTGNTVTTGEVFYRFNSCDSIRKVQDTMPENGQYIITPTGSSVRVLVNCYFTGSSDSDPAVTFLVYFGNDFAAAPVLGDCTKVLGTHAEKMLGTATSVNHAALLTSLDFVSRTNKAELATQVLDAQQSLENACAIYGTADVQVTDGSTTITNDVTKAEPGVYRITFDGEDRVGNKCPSIIRTVIVRDTLPPVISLVHPTRAYSGATNADGSFVNDNMVFQHTSDGAVGLNGQRNWDTPGGAAHHAFMAETSSVNGWFIGAVACAVSGVALLATSMKKAATSVPV